MYRESNGNIYSVSTEQFLGYPTISGLTERDRYQYSIQNAKQTYQQQTYQQSVYQQPAYQQPAYQQTAYEQPAYQQLVQQEYQEKAKSTKPRKTINPTWMLVIMLVMETGLFSDFIIDVLYAFDPQSLLSKNIMELYYTFWYNCLGAYSIFVFIVDIYMEIKLVSVIKKQWRDHIALIIKSIFCVAICCLCVLGYSNRWYSDPAYWLGSNRMGYILVTIWMLCLLKKAGCLKNTLNYRKIFALVFCIYMMESINWISYLEVLVTLIKNGMIKYPFFMLILVILLVYVAYSMIRRSLTVKLHIKICLYLMIAATAVLYNLLYTHCIWTPYVLGVSWTINYQDFLWLFIIALVVALGITEFVDSVLGEGDLNEQ